MRATATHTSAPFAGRKPAPTRKEIWASFCADAELRRTYNIKDDELAMLSRTAMLGNWTSKTDLLFMLRVVRSAAPR